MKEILTLENIKSDLRLISYSKSDIIAEWRFSYIIPCTIIGLIVGFYYNIWFLAAIFFLVSLYHIIRYVIAIRQCLIEKKAVNEIVERGNISITVKKLSRVANETVYEPHRYGKRARSTKEITVFNFESGCRWRAPDVRNHYKYSSAYRLTTKGLENISIRGDEFYYIHIQNHYNVAYIYPCKIFKLDSALQQNSIFDEQEF